MIPRRPGQFLRSQLLRMIVGVGLILVLCLVLAGLGFVWWPLSLIAFPILAYVNWAMEKGRRFDPLPKRRGLTGEETVAEAVAPLLLEGYWLLSDIDKGQGNIDHVVGGPTGVFAIEVKAWTGSFYPRGGKLFHSNRDASQVVRQAMSEALAVKDRLARDGIPRPWVEAFVVSTRSEVLSKKGGLDFGSVRVIHISRLVEEIRSRRPRYSANDLHRIRATILRWDLGPLRVRSISQE